MIFFGHFILIVIIIFPYNTNCYAAGLAETISAVMTSLQQAANRPPI